MNERKQLKQYDLADDPAHWFKQSIKAPTKKRWNDEMKEGS
jgi:hypothetical protein